MKNWTDPFDPFSATDGTVTVSYVYDYIGRLVKRDDGTTETYYAYDDWNRIATFTLQSSTLTLQSTNLWGLDLSLTLQGAGGVGGLLREGNLYPLYDANGNITQKLDDSGNTSMAVVYDPFGNIISGSLVGKYGFSSKPLDADTRLVYFGYRWHEPTMGRWISRDPLFMAEMLPEGPNLYAYVGNDSVNKKDFLGLQMGPLGACGSKEASDFWHEDLMGRSKKEREELTKEQLELARMGQELGVEIATSGIPIPKVSGYAAQVTPDRNTWFDRFLDSLTSWLANRMFRQAGKELTVDDYRNPPLRDDRRRKRECDEH